MLSEIPHPELLMFIVVSECVAECVNAVILPILGGETKARTMFVVLRSNLHETGCEPFEMFLRAVTETWL